MIGHSSGSRASEHAVLHPHLTRASSSEKHTYWLGEYMAGIRQTSSWPPIQAGYKPNAVADSYHECLLEGTLSREISHNLKVQDYLPLVADNDLAQTY